MGAKASFVVSLNRLGVRLYIFSFIICAMIEIANSTSLVPEADDTTFLHDLDFQSEMSFQETVSVTIAPQAPHLMQSLESSAMTGGQQHEIASVTATPVSNSQHTPTELFGTISPLMSAGRVHSSSSSLFNILSLDHETLIGSDGSVVDLLSSETDGAEIASHLPTRSVRNQFEYNTPSLKVQDLNSPLYPSSPEPFSSISLVSEQLSTFSNPGNINSPGTEYYHSIQQHSDTTDEITPSSLSYLNVGESIPTSLYNTNVNVEITPSSVISSMVGESIPSSLFENNDNVEITPSSVVNSMVSESLPSSIYRTNGKDEITSLSFVNSLFGESIPSSIYKTNDIDEITPLSVINSIPPSEYDTNGNNMNNFLSTILPHFESKSSRDNFSLDDNESKVSPTSYLPFDNDQSNRISTPETHFTLTTLELQLDNETPRPLVLTDTATIQIDSESKDSLFSIEPVDVSEISVNRIETDTIGIESTIDIEITISYTTDLQSMDADFTIMEDSSTDIPPLNSYKSIIDITQSISNQLSSLENVYASSSSPDIQVSISPTEFESSYVSITNDVEISTQSIDSLQPLFSITSNADIQNSELETQVEDSIRLKSSESTESEILAETIQYSTQPENIEYSTSSNNAETSYYRLSESILSSMVEKFESESDIQSSIETSLPVIFVESLSYISFIQNSTLSDQFSSDLRSFTSQHLSSLSQFQHESLSDSIAGESNGFVVLSTQSAFLTTESVQTQNHTVSIEVQQTSSIDRSSELDIKPTRSGYSKHESESSMESVTQLVNNTLSSAGWVKNSSNEQSFLILFTMKGNCTVFENNRDNIHQLEYSLGHLIDYVIERNINKSFNNENIRFKEFKCNPFSIIAILSTKDISFKRIRQILLSSKEQGNKIQIDVNSTPPQSIEIISFEIIYQTKPLVVGATTIINKIIIVLAACVCGVLVVLGTSFLIHERLCKNINTPFPFYVFGIKRKKSGNISVSGLPRQTSIHSEMKDNGSLTGYYNPSCDVYSTIEIETTTSFMKSSDIRRSSGRTRRSKRNLQNKSNGSVKRISNNKDTFTSKIGQNGKPFGLVVGLMGYKPNQTEDVYAIPNKPIKKPKVYGLTIGLTSKRVLFNMNQATRKKTDLPIIPPRRKRSRRFLKNGEITDSKENLILQSNENTERHGVDRVGSGIDNPSFKNDDVLNTQYDSKNSLNI